MRKVTLTVILLSVLSLGTTLLAGCNGNGDDDTQAFVLGECQLDDAACRLQ